MEATPTVSNFCLFVLIYYDFLAKKWVKVIIVPSFRLQFDDVTVTLSLIVLSQFFLQTHLDTILLHAKICQD